MNKVEIVTEVADETTVISLSDVKSHLYITHTDDDTYLTTLIGKARKQVEHLTSRAIGTQAFRWTVDLCAGEEYKIPYGPVSTFTSASLKEAINSYTSLTVNTDYEVEGLDLFRCFTTGRYKILYSAGYSTLPANLKQAILIQIGWLYERRGSEDSAGVSQAAKDLSSPYKDYSWT